MTEQVIDLIFGRWRGQILFAGTELGIFDRLDRTAPRTARQLAADMDVDAGLLYRLLRAQASIGLLVEDSSGGFTLTESGDLLRVATSTLVGGHGPAGGRTAALRAVETSSGDDQGWQAECICAGIRPHGIRPC